MLSTHDAQLKDFQTRLERREYLVRLTDGMVFDNYKGVIEDSGTGPFTGFTDENSAYFYKLKVRLIEEKISSAEN